MTDSKQREVTLVLAPMTARDLMSPNPVSIRGSAPVVEATTLLTERGFGAVPVIDSAGRPVGVVSRTDLLVHNREHLTHQTAIGRSADLDEDPSEEVDPTPVSDIMTPTVLTVPLGTSGEQVVARMLALHVHQLFVVDAGGILVGVISALDILRHVSRASPSS